MSVASLRKTNTEIWLYVWSEYRKEHPGPICLEKANTWALEKKLINLPKVDPVKLLLRDARRAARDVRIIDQQDRKVRAMLPAKIPLEVDENGNTLLWEMQYDDIHEMSAHHALLAFEQRDDNIKKQQRSASRDLASFLDNNPNAKGREEQFVFDFMTEKQEPQVVEKIEESRRPKPR